MAASQEGTSVQTVNQLQTILSQLITNSQNTGSFDASEQQSVFEETQVLDKELFLQALSEYKCLWDTSDSNYKNRNMKVNAWNALSQMFNQEASHLQKTFKNLKDSLKKCMDKRRALTKSGASASTLPTCKYFENMTFLHDKTSNLPTHSNVDIILNDSIVETTEAQPQQEEIFNHLSSSTPTSSYSATPIPSKGTKRKNSIDKKSECDPFLDQIKKMDERLLDGLQAEKENDKDEATLFCMSLILTLKVMDKKKLRLTKVKIQQLLFDIEYEN